MAELFLGFLALGYILYILVIQIPRQIRMTEEKIDILKLNLQEIEIKLNNISKKLDNR